MFNEESESRKRVVPATKKASLGGEEAKKYTWGGSEARECLFGPDLKIGKPKTRGRA